MSHLSPGGTVGYPGKRSVAHQVIGLVISDVDAARQDRPGRHIHVGVLSVVRRSDVAADLPEAFGELVADADTAEVLITVVPTTGSFPPQGGAVVACPVAPGRRGGEGVRRTRRRG